MPAASRRTGRPRAPTDVRVTAAARIPLRPLGVAALAAAVVRAERGALAALSITFVGPARIRALHRAHLGADRLTDVIAFALRPSAVGRPPSAVGRRPSTAIVGDVYVCAAVAAREAARTGTTLKAELRRLVIHGVLHVLGHDHPDGATRTTSAMWRRQECYLRRFSRLAP